MHSKDLQLFWVILLQINNNSCPDKEIWIQSTTCILLTETVSSELAYNLQPFQGHVWDGLFNEFLLFHCNIIGATENIGKEKLSCKERHKRA